MQFSPSSAASVARVHMLAGGAGLGQRPRILKWRRVDDLRAVLKQQTERLSLARPIDAGLYCAAGRNPDGSAAAAILTRRQAGHRADQRLSSADQVGLLKQQPETLPVLVIGEGV